MRLFKRSLRWLASAVLAAPAAVFLRFLGASGRVVLEGFPYLRVRSPYLPRTAIYAFWHEHLVNATAYLGTRVPGSGATILIGTHADAEIIARIVHKLGLRTVRGSRTRGGREALRHLLQVMEEGRCIGFTPDGPKGPRRRASSGVIVLAQRAQVPIVPIAAAARPALRAGSWDRMQFPMPFARVCAVEGAQVRVPADAGPEERERARARLERELNAIVERAERVAAGGRAA